MYTSPFSRCDTRTPNYEERYAIVYHPTTFAKPSEPGSWGRVYVCHLAVKLGGEYLLRRDQEAGLQLEPSKDAVGVAELQSTIC